MAQSPKHTSLTVRWASPGERERWDELVAENPFGGDFLQSATYALAKASVGWKLRYLVFERDGQRESVALMLEKHVPFLGKYWYGSHAPATVTAHAFLEHTVALRSFIRGNAKRVFAATLEPPVATSEAEEQTLATSALITDGTLIRGDGIQANTHTVILDVQRDDDTLIASFDKKCRNMVRRALRDGVEVHELPPTRATYDEMHRLMRLVGGGKGQLALRSKEYTETLWNGFVERGQGRFFGISVDGTLAVTAFVIKIGDRAFYKDGGSDRSIVTPGMSNAMQWELMRMLRDEDVKTYDLIGVAPESAKSDADHHSYSLGKFKLSFGPRTSAIGTFDLVLKPTNYRLWDRGGHHIYQKLHRVRHNDLSLH